MATKSEGRAPGDPKAAALIAARSISRDDRRLRSALAVVFGAFAGLILSAATILVLTLLVPMNAIAVLGLLSLFVGGGIVLAAGRVPSSSRIVASTAYWAALEAGTTLQQKLAGIPTVAQALRASGLPDAAVDAHCVALSDQAYAVYLETLERAGRTTPRPLPPSADSPRITALPNFPAPLITAKARGKLVPFVGAGLSLGPDVSGKFPPWRDLPRRLLASCDHHSVWRDENDRASLRRRFLEPDPKDPTKEVPCALPLKEMLSELDIIKEKLGRDYRKALDAIFRPRDAAPGAAHRAIMSTGARVVLTTNYDQLLEAVEGPPSRQVYTWKQATSALADIEEGLPVLFKVHGSVQDCDSVILTNKEYSALRGDDPYVRVMGHLLHDCTLLFIGYGLSDPSDLDILLSRTVIELGVAARRHYALFRRTGDRTADAELRSRLRDDHNIEVIWYDDHADLVPLLDALAGASSHGEV